MVESSSKAVSECYYDDEHRIRQLIADRDNISIWQVHLLSCVWVYGWNKGIVDAVINGAFGLCGMLKGKNSLLLIEYHASYTNGNLIIKCPQDKIDLR